jgi:hypothetical protein
LVRNLRSTGNLTWSAQELELNNSTYAVSWVNITIALSADWQTMEIRNGNDRRTITRVQ